MLAERPTQRRFIPKNASKPSFLSSRHSSNASSERWFTLAFYESYPDVARTVRSENLNSMFGEPKS